VLTNARIIDQMDENNRNQVLGWELNPLAIDKPIRKVEEVRRKISALRNK
jgi:hypothetical protein